MSVTVSRISNQSGIWCPLRADKEPWLQVHFGKMVTVKEIETILAYSIFWPTCIVKYSYNGQTWYNVSKQVTLQPVV